MAGGLGDSMVASHDNTSSQHRRQIGSDAILGLELIEK